MADPKGFLTTDRETPKRRPVDLRLMDWREVYEDFPRENLEKQAGRCMNCGIPFCHQGCPLGNLIPEWNDQVWRHDWREAVERLHATNNFPEFTGTLCPAPCEAACVLGINQQPVTIKQVEIEIIDRAWDEGWVTPQPAQTRTGKKVAVVGSGPAGLAAAQQLTRVGHEVVVFERADRIGGLLRYGIPEFKMEKSRLDRRLQQMKDEGTLFRASVDVGSAIDAPPVSAEGKHVVIIGGGDTGADCLGTSHRQGAASVTQLEIMPTPPEHRTDGMPWPTYPMVYRVSSAHEEGGERLFAVNTTEFVGDEDGNVRALRLVEVTRDESGRFVPTEGTERELKADLVLLAMGFVGPEKGKLVTDLGVDLDERGNVARDDQYMTSVDGVFSAGDMGRGQSLIVWAIAEGRSAAAGVDRFLTGRAVLPRPINPTDRQIA